MRIKVIIILLLFPSLLFSQDNIILIDGKEISAEILEIDSKEIKYKRTDNLEGPIYKKPVSDIFIIKYKNGTKDVFNTFKTGSASQIDEQKVKKYNYGRFAVRMNPHIWLPNISLNSHSGRVIGIELDIFSKDNTRSIYFGIATKRKNSPVKQMIRFGHSFYFNPGPYALKISSEFSILKVPILNYPEDIIEDKNVNAFGIYAGPLIQARNINININIGYGWFLDSQTIDENSGFICLTTGIGFRLNKK